MPHRFFVSLLALLAAVLLGAPHPVLAQYAASPFTQLSVHSDPGESVGQGKNYLFNANDGEFQYALRTNSAGKVNDIVVYFDQGAGGESWETHFSSQGLGTELIPGAYNGAHDDSPDGSGYPGLDVSADSRGAGSATGTFTVTEAVYDYTASPPTLVHFAASFVFHAEGSAPALTGTIYYHSNTHPQVPDTSHPTTTAVLTGTIGKYGRYSGPVQVSLSATDPDGTSDVAATYYTIDGGAPQTYTTPFTISVDGLHSVRYYSKDRVGNLEGATLRTAWIDRAPLPSVSAQSYLLLHSPPGELSGLGRDYLYTDRDGSFTTTAYQGYFQTDAPINTVNVFFETSDQQLSWSLIFSTRELGTPIAVGNYENALREGVEASGHPGLDVNGFGGAGDTVEGRFSIIDLVLDYSQSATAPRVVSFAATFEQRIDGEASPLTGTIYYHSTAYVGTPVQVTFAPAPSHHGQFVGTVALASPAPAGGEAVALSSDTPAVAAVPATVVVPAGALSASFPVNVATSLAPASVEITASAFGVSQTATLPVRPLTTWAATAIATGPDGKSRILWSKSDGAITLWTLNADNSAAAYSPVFGPFTGWTATALSVGPDNAAHVLWTNNNGAGTVWTFPAAGSAPAYGPVYGPFAGWTATNLATGSDGKTRLLWNTQDGRVTLWTIPPGGSPSYGPVYGPYSGWSAKSIAMDTANAVHLLWDNSDGRMTLWTLPATGSPTYSLYYGPFVGLTATALCVDSQGTEHVQWNDVNGRMELWTFPNATSQYMQSVSFGLYVGWTAVGFSLGPDDRSHVLWDNVSGAITPWTLDTAGHFVGTFPVYGPY